MVVNTDALLDELVTKIKAAVPADQLEEFWTERFVPYNKEQQKDAHILLKDGPAYLKYPFAGRMKARLLSNNALSGSKFNV